MNTPTTVNHTPVMQSFGAAASRQVEIEPESSGGLSCAPMLDVYDAYLDTITDLSSKADVTEADLSAPTQQLLGFVDVPVSVRPEQTIADTTDDRRSKRPDFEVRTSDDSRVIGYVELKHPNKASDPRRLSSPHDTAQWNSFRALPNVVYSNGQTATLWRDGTLTGSASMTDRPGWLELWSEFCSYTPQIDSAPSALAATMGRRVSLLRDSVTDALTARDPSLGYLLDLWRGLLSAEFTEDAFADNFAQTAMAGLLLARGLTTEETTFGLSVAADALNNADHAVLAEVLEHISKAARSDNVLDVHLSSIVDAVTAVDVTKPSNDDWWVEFFEAFIREYDRQLQQDRGVFYTPKEIVDYQIRSADWLLRNHLGKPDGFADEKVTTLDPACGTGTYLLRLIDYVSEQTRQQRGEGAVTESTQRTIDNAHGFEVMVAPYTISRMRLAAKSRALGANPAPNQVNLTDTLSAPSAQQSLIQFVNQAITEEQARANQVKDPATRVTVVLGNPPYDRDQSQAGSKPSVPVADRFGGIIRHGDGKQPPLINTFKKQTTPAGRRQFHACYELATYFWRWAVWKVCEQVHPGATSPGGPGVVSFITPSAWLRSEPWSGMRHHLRQKFDHVWVVDLGGDHRSARDDGENVFPIRTPVCVTVAVRDGTERPEPATVRYRKLFGSRSDKLEALSELSLHDDGWDTADTADTAWFVASAAGGLSAAYTGAASIDEVLTWCSPGVQYNRSWPIAVTDDVLTRRWEQLASAPPTTKTELFKETRDRNLTKDKIPSPLHRHTPPPPRKLSDLKSGDAHLTPVRYGHRPFDIRKAIPDHRLGDMMRPKLWECHSDNQAYLVTAALTEPAGQGPTAVVFTDIPDKHSHHGRVGTVFPLWRDTAATDANTDPVTVNTLSDRYEQPVTGEDIWYYCAGFLGTDAHQRVFGDAMSHTIKPHVPFPQSHDDFAVVVDIGHRLVEISRRIRLDWSGVKCTIEVDSTQLPLFKDRCYNASEETLEFGGGVFTGVTPEIWEHQVSGYKTLRRWIKSRSANPGGRRTSPLDEITPMQWSFTSELIVVCDQIASLNKQAATAGPILERLSDQLS